MVCYLYVVSLAPCKRFGGNLYRIPNYSIVIARFLSSCFLLFVFPRSSNNQNHLIFLIPDWLYGNISRHLYGIDGNDFEDDVDFDDEFDENSQTCFNESAIAAYHNGDDTLLTSTGNTASNVKKSHKSVMRRVVGLKKIHSQKNVARNAGQFECPKCRRWYTAKGSRDRHLRYECGREPRQQCTFCPHRTIYRSDLKKHMQHKHEFVSKD